MSALTNLLAVIGSAGNSLGVQGDNPMGLNALQRAALSPEASGALEQQTRAVNTPIDISDPNLAQKAADNPAYAAKLQQYMSTQSSQAMQPLSLASINNLKKNGALTGPDALGAQVLLSAYGTKDAGRINDAYKMLYDKNAELAGRIKGEQEGNTLFKLPDGTYVQGKKLGAGAAPEHLNVPAGYPAGLPQPNATPSAPAGYPAGLPTSPPAEGEQDYLSELTAPKGGAQEAPQQTPNAPLAGDGKPILPGMTNLFPPDPSGTPRYRTENTETGVAQTKAFIDSDSKANDSWANNRNSLTKEGAIIDSVTQQLANVQPGTTLAQFPDVVNRLVGAGLVSKDTANKLSDIQSVRTFLMKDAILQLRDQNANLEGNPSRIMQAELSANLEHGLSAALQPEALFKVLTQAKGMVNYNKDMIDTYQKIGGLGNRVANGYTKRPNDFAQQWQAQHNPSEYVKQAEKETPPFKGMEEPKSDWQQTPTGHKYRVIK